MRNVAWPLRAAYANQAAWPALMSLGWPAYSWLFARLIIAACAPKPICVAAGGRLRGRRSTVKSHESHGSGQVELDLLSNSFRL